MASKYDGLARIILQNVGGKENINDVFHCVTRLRFRLKDESKAQTDVLETVDDIIQVIQAGGQYQIVIGTHVADVYDAVLQVGHLKGSGEVDEDGNAMDSGESGDTNAINRAIELISGIIRPTLSTLAGAGILKGLLALASFFKIMQVTDGSYMILNSFADGFFYFLPVVLGYTSAKKFHANEFFGMAMGFALTYPAMVASTGGEVLGTVLSGTPFEMSYYLTLFGIPVIFPASGYASSVVPVVLAVFMVSKLEKLFKNIVPSVLSFFGVPLLTMSLGVIVTYLLIGPAATLLTRLVLLMFNAIMAIPVVGPTLFGAALGGCFQIFVIFGLHWAFIPLYLANFAEFGFDTILPAQVACTMAQTAAVFAIYLKATDKRTRNICLPAVITGFLGITEPAIYGASLPRKKPFVFSCIASACAGGFTGFMGTKMFTSGVSGIMGLARYIDPTGAEGLTNMYEAGIAMIIAIAVGFLLTWFFWNEKAWEEKAAAAKAAK